MNWALDDLESLPASMLAALPFTEEELEEARRVNRFLSWMPRFRPRGRLKTAAMQGLLCLKQAWPSRQLEKLGVSLEKRTVTWGGRDVELRIIRPKTKARGVYLDIHGGAWIVGNAKVDDPINGLVAAECGMAVASVEYRLATDGRLDLALADCLTAARWLIENRRVEFGAGCIFMGGESAGAHLVACTLQALKAEGGLANFGGAVLFYGIYDMSGTPSIRRAGRETLVLHGPSAYRNLLRLTPGMNEAERRTPQISPLYGDLAGHPPALFLVGTLDPLIDDTLMMAERWQAANANAELVVAPESPHAFNRLGTSLAGRTNAYVRRWLRERLNAKPGEG